jgi:hypothetical protein
MNSVQLSVFTQARGTPDVEMTCVTFAQGPEPGPAFA